MSSIQSIETPQDYVNYTFNLSSRGVTEVTSELAGMSSTVSNLMGLMAFKTSEYLSNTEALITSFGYAAVATFSKATSQAIQFEQALANVKAIGGESINEIEIGQAAMQYSNQLGMSVSSMTEGLEALSRAGLTATDVMSNVLAEGVKLSKLEGMDLEDSINNLISTTNLLAEGGYDVNTQEYADMVKAMNQHIVSTSESAPINAHNIIQTLQHVGGYASASGIDQDDLFAVIAQLGSKGTKGEMAGTALRAFIAAGQKDSAQRALKRIGLDVTDLWTESGEAMLPVSEMKAVLDEALESRGYSKQEKLEFYSDFAGYKQANQIMKINTEEVQEYKKSIDQAWDLGRKLDEILGTVHSNIQIIAQTTTNFLTRVGQTALPILNAILQPIKWAVQLIDKIPFSEQFVGLGLAFVGLKGIFTFINRVVPAVASLYTSFDRPEKKAKGIAGHFKNLKRDALETKETIENIRNPEFLARKRMENDKYGMGSVEYGLAVAEDMYGSVRGRDITGKDFWELSKYQRNQFIDYVVSLGKDKQIYQTTQDRIDAENQALAQAIIDSEAKSQPIIYQVDKGSNWTGNVERNQEINLQRQSYKESTDQAKKNNDIAASTKQSVDNVLNVTKELISHIKGHTDNTKQYDIGKGIMSVAKPLADIFAETIFKRFNLKEFNTRAGKIQFDSDVGKQASQELENIFNKVQSAISDLPDISFHYDNDIEKMQDKVKTLRNEIATTAKIFSNIDISNMTPYQGRRALKTIDIKAMGNIGLDYSKMMNEAYIREVLKQDSFDKNNKFIEKIYDEQVTKLAESLNVDISNAKNKIDAVEKIYNKFHEKGQRKSITEVVQSSKDWYDSHLTERKIPSIKELTNDDSKYIMERLGIQYSANNDITQQLQTYFSSKDVDASTKWIAQELVLAIQKQKAEGVYSGPEKAELEYMVTHLEALNQSINRLMNEPKMPLSFIPTEADGSYQGWTPEPIPIGNIFEGALGLPEMNNKNNLIYSFLQDVPIILDNALPSLGMADADKMFLNPIKAYSASGGNPMEAFSIFLEAYIHEMSHMLLQHIPREGLSDMYGHSMPYDITSKHGNPVQEAEVNSVVSSVLKYLGLSNESVKAAQSANKWTQQATSMGVADEINQDMIRTTAQAIKNNIIPIMMRFIDVSMNKNYSNFAPIYTAHNTDSTQLLMPSIFREGLQKTIQDNNFNNLSKALLLEVRSDKSDHLQRKIDLLKDNIQDNENWLKEHPNAQPEHKKWKQDEIDEWQEELNNLSAQKAENDVKNLEAHGLLIDNNPFEVIIKILNAINDNVVIATQYITGDKRKKEIKSLPKFKTFTDDEINLHKADDTKEKIKQDAESSSSFTDNIYTNQQYQEYNIRNSQNYKKEQENKNKQRIQELRKIISQPIMPPSFTNLSSLSKEDKIEYVKTIQQYYKEKTNEIEEAQKELDTLLKIEAEKEAKKTQSIINEGNEKYLQEYGDRILNEAQSTHGISQGFQQPKHIPAVYMSSEERSYLTMQGGRDAYINYLSNQSRLDSPKAPTSISEAIEYGKEATELYEHIEHIKNEMRYITGTYYDWYQEVQNTDTVIQYLYTTLQNIQDTDITKRTQDLQDSFITFYGTNAQYEQYLLEEQQKASDALKEQQKIIEDTRNTLIAKNEVPNVSYGGNVEYSRIVSGLYDADLSGPVSKEQGQRDIDAANAYIDSINKIVDVHEAWLHSIEANIQAIEAQTELLNIAKNITEEEQDKVDRRNAEENLQPLFETTGDYILGKLTGDYSQFDYIPTMTPPVDEAEAGLRNALLDKAKFEIIALQNKEVEKSIEKMRDFFKEHASSWEKDNELMKKFHEEHVKAIEEEINKINKLRDIVNNMKDIQAQAEYNKLLDNLEQEVKDTQANLEALNNFISTDYNKSNVPSFIDEEGMNYYTEQIDIMKNTIPNAQAIIAQEQNRIQDEINKTAVERFTTSDKTDIPEDVDGSEFLGVSEPESYTNPRASLNRMKEKIHRNAQKVLYEEQKDLLEWATNLVDTLRYTISGQILDTEEERTAKQLHADEAAKQMRQNLDAQQKAEDELNEAKRIETQKNINNINRQNRQTYARMKRSEKRAKRLADKNEELEKAEAEHLKKIGEQQTQMLRDFVDSMGVLLSIGEAINRKNVEDVHSLPVTDEDWEHVDDITEEDYRASRRAANRMRENANIRKRKTPEELEQERVDKDWVENNGVNLTSEEFYKKLEEEENSLTRKENADIKANLRKSHEEAKQRREQREEEKKQQRRQGVIDNQKAREKERKRIDDLFYSGKIDELTPEEFEAKLEEETFNWNKYNEKMAETIRAMNGTIDKTLTELEEANQKADERKAKIEHANNAAKQAAEKEKRIQEQRTNMVREYSDAVGVLLAIGENIEKGPMTKAEAKIMHEKNKKAFEEEQEKIQQQFEDDLVMINRLVPGLLDTMKHQLSLATTPAEDAITESIERAKQGEYNHVMGVPAGTTISEEEQEQIRNKYSHIQGVGVNPEYEGLSFIEREKMKLDHKYGKEYVGGSGEDDIPIKRKQSWGERIARWSLGTRAKINELPEKIPDKSEEAAVLRERLGGTQEKLQNIIGPMEAFNDGLSRAAEIFPPLSGVAWGFNTALEFMYGIQSALEFVQLLLNSEKFVEMLVNTGLISAETAVNIAKGTETATTLLLTGAIGALEALLAGPVLIVIGIIIAALAVLYISEKNHAEALKANKKALEESSKSMNAAQAAYKSARNARISETNAAKKHQNALKESIALNHLAAERRKRLSEVEKKAMLEHDALWGETNSIRTGVQTGNGIGGIIGFISPLTKLLAGEYENISDKHSENIKQITSIVDSANTDKGFWQNAWDNYDNQYASQVNAYYNEHAREFATMDTFSPQLEKLYQAETQAQKIYGQEGARNSEMFLKAMQEAATDTGLSGDELAQYLDYMQTEANVENARETAKAGFGQIQASIQQKAMQKLYPDGDRMGDLGSVENAMVLAAVEDEARKAKTDLWQSAMLEVTQAIYAAMRLDFDSAGKHWDAAFTYYDGMQEIDKNKEKIAQESLSIAQEDIRKDYGTQSYSFYGDTPFGGAVASAKSAGMKVINHGSSQTSITEHTSSNTSLSNSYNDAADIAQKQLDTAAEALQEDYGAQNNENHIGLIDRALKFAANLHPAVGFITSLFGDDATESTTTESSQPVINKYEININTININTEDNPEKIKTAFMNLMIEMSEQITPRYVSRTTGQMSNTNEQSNGTEINYNNNNPNNI